MMSRMKIFIAGVQLLGFLFNESFAAILQPALAPATFPRASLVCVSGDRRGSLLSEAIIIRGGDIALPSDDDGGIVLTKLRNVIRSFLKFSEKKVPPLASLVRLCCKSFESVTGIRLMSSKKNKKPKKKKSKTESEEESDVEEKSADEEGKPKAKKNKTVKKPSATTKKHLSTELKSTNPNFRIQRELKEFIKSPPPNLSVQVGSNIRVWIVTMVGAKNSIYEGEVFKLRVSFPPQYPTVPPSVYFLQGHIPVHEHVYTNGDICLSLLGKDWRPTMTAQSIAVSILSILSSAQSKALPMDNARHAGNKPGEYQKDWVYHDDNC